MATAYDSILYVYKGVPLVKNGTEVLFESQDNAIIKLEGFLHKWYFNYYYIRENRRYVRVKAVMTDIEGCNYIAFKNRGNGDKWFFGFIDRLVYVNDNTVEIEFTIDPFPTYLGDTQMAEYGFIVRNTPLYDTLGNYLQDDYMPSSAKVEYTVIQETSVEAKDAYCYFAISDGSLTIPSIYNPFNNLNTGIKVFYLTDSILDIIQAHNGIIIGAYLCPNWYDSTHDGYPIYRDLGTIGGNPFANFGTYHNNKLKTGVYNSIVLNTSQGSKTYQLELFSDRTNVQFQMIGLMAPCPSIFVYPKNYKGVVDNLSEGMYVKFPAIPISANAVYTISQKTDDMWSLFTGIFGGAGAGAGAGFMYGGPYGAAIGAIGGAWMGGITGVAEIGKHQFHSRFNPPTVAGMGEPTVSLNGKIYIQLLVSRPSSTDLGRIDRYLDYYGYNISAEETISTLGTNTNLSDNAYIQTGSDIFKGSEMDAEINARLKAGVKIKRNLATPVP